MRSIIKYLWFYRKEGSLTTHHFAGEHETILNVYAISDSILCHWMKNILITDITWFSFDPFGKENFVHLYLISSNFLLNFPFRNTTYLTTHFILLPCLQRAAEILGNTTPEDTKLFSAPQCTVHGIILFESMLSDVISHCIHYQISCSKFCIGTINHDFYPVSSVLIMVGIPSIIFVICNQRIRSLRGRLITIQIKWMKY
jgi:hypothetical protein